MKKLNYWKRLFKAYVLKNTSQLTFWHNEPTINKNYNKNKVGHYYMLFHSKAKYSGYFDSNGIPMLNYHGTIGLQYNPIAISQWGLGNYNLWRKTNDRDSYDKFIKSADWLVDNIKKNKYGVNVWFHEFDFEYRDKLKSPWYSGLAQGQAISVLVRAFIETGISSYKITAQKAIDSFNIDVSKGGVNFRDKNGYNWVEEYIVFPPTHILNGFIWALWGIFDYAIVFDSKKYKKKFYNYSNTLINNLHQYDNIYWSKYELSNKLISMISSHFYHKLHIVQLKIMYDLTDNDVYLFYSNKWQKQLQNLFCKNIAFIHKAIFKVLYY